MATTFDVARRNELNAQLAALQTAQARLNAVAPNLTPAQFSRVAGHLLNGTISQWEVNNSRQVAAELRLMARAQRHSGDWRGARQTEHFSRIVTAFANAESAARNPRVMRAERDELNRRIRNEGVYQEPVYQEPIQEPEYREPEIYQEPIYREPIYREPIDRRTPGQIARDTIRDAAARAAAETAAEALADRIRYAFYPRHHHHRRA